MHDIACAQVKLIFIPINQVNGSIQRLLHQHPASLCCAALSVGGTAPLAKNGYLTMSLLLRRSLWVEVKLRDK